MRRDPFTMGKIKQRAKLVVSDDGTTRWHSIPAPGLRLTPEELDYLAHYARIPLADREAFENWLKRYVDLYWRRRRSAEQEAPQNKAEALGLCATAARDDITNSPERKKRRGPRRWRQIMLPPSLQLEIERISPGATRNVSSYAYIEAIESLKERYEKRVSQKRTRNQETHDRNILARNLKGLAMWLSPMLRADARGAEKWAAQVLDTLGIRYPADTDYSAFAGMFGHQGLSAQTYAEAQIADAAAMRKALFEEIFATEIAKASSLSAPPPVGGDRHRDGEDIGTFDAPREKQ
jgi:hypothetical protein